MSKSGRFRITKGGRTFVVEPIDNFQGMGRKKWGDIDPATKTVTGDYGNKSVGAVTEQESIITKENGYNDIHYTGVGVSPDSFIDKILAESVSKSKH